MHDTKPCSSSGRSSVRIPHASSDLLSRTPTWQGYTPAPAPLVTNEALRSCWAVWTEKLRETKKSRKQQCCSFYFIFFYISMCGIYTHSLFLLLMIKSTRINNNSVPRKLWEKRRSERALPSLLNIVVRNQAWEIHTKGAHTHECVSLFLRRGEEKKELENDHDGGEYSYLQCSNWLYSRSNTVVANYP